MYSQEFIDDHHRRCDKSETDSEVLGQIEAALDGLKGRGVEKVAFDLEGTLASLHVDGCDQLRRATTNAVLRLTADRMAVKPIIWTAAELSHASYVIEAAQIAVPEGVEVVDCDAFHKSAPSVSSLFLETDYEECMSTILGKFKGSLAPNSFGFLHYCCLYIVKQFGEKRLLDYCGVTDGSSLSDLCDMRKETALDSVDLRSLKRTPDLKEIGGYLASLLGDIQGKLPHVLGVDLLVDDISSRHRVANVLLGHTKGADAVCRVSAFKMFPPPVDGAPVTYSFGGLVTLNDDNYFAADRGLIRALENGPLNRSQSK